MWAPRSWTRAPPVPPSSRAYGVRGRGHRQDTGPRVWVPTVAASDSIRQTWPKSLLHVCLPGVSWGGRGVTQDPFGPPPPGIDRNVWNTKKSNCTTPVYLRRHPPGATEADCRSWTLAAWHWWASEPPSTRHSRTSATAAAYLDRPLGSWGFLGARNSTKRLRI